MSERFTQLFHAADNLYGVGSPILIVAGVLLYDEGTGSVVAQLKFQNITEKPIKAVKVKLELLDSGSRKLGESLEYQYCLDLYAERDDEFGQKTAIILSDRTARSFSVSVIEVIFSDDSIWTGNEEPWNYTLKKSRLEELGDPELAVQYCIETTGYSECVPCVYKEYDLWRCACGVINHADEKVCHSCGQELDFLLSVLDVEKLKTERDMRLRKNKEEQPLPVDEESSDLDVQKTSFVLENGIKAETDCEEEILDKESADHKEVCINQENEIAIEEVADTGGGKTTQPKNTTKKKFIALAIITILVICIVVAAVTTSKKNAMEEYETNLELVTYSMLSGAADAEKAGNLIKNVWYNAIWHEYDAETFKYTSGSSDFNAALRKLFSDSEFSSQISDIESNQSLVQSLMQSLNDPPEEYETAYQDLLDYYDAYLELTNFVISPTGSLTTFSSSFRDADSEVINALDKVKLHIKGGEAW